MPEIGTVTKGIEIGRAKANLFIWQACDQCGKERWVRLIRGIPKNTRCLTCERKTITHATGEKAHNWTGGKAKNHAGYVLTILQPDDFFFPMTSRRTKRANYVMEHRLIMAKYLNRCLLPWEVVHHKNGIKNDNRIENLQLITDQRFHMVDLQVKAYIAVLEKKIANFELVLDAKEKEWREKEAEWLKNWDWDLEKYNAHIAELREEK